MDHHNGSEVMDAITCHRGLGGKAPQRGVKVEEPAGVWQ